VSGRAGICEVWGILNVTPDSFSDGGRFDDLERATAHGSRMLGQGAAVIDVGGESSRPAGATYGAGAERVSTDEELRRVVPVVRALCAAGARVSVDTVKAEVARAALEAGATIVNDVSNGASEALLDVVAEHGAELVLMHTRGGGRVDADTTRYVDVVEDVLAELLVSVERAVDRGVLPQRIWIDPGIGFAKTAPQSLALLNATARFASSGHRVLVGASRKSFIAHTVGAATAPAPDERLGGSIAAVALAVLGGAAAVRVHDVYESAQAVALVARAASARDGGSASTSSFEHRGASRLASEVSC
jgi:dihydropteroate synthase